MAKKKEIGFKELDAKLDRVIDVMLKKDDVLHKRIDSLEKAIDMRFEQVMIAIDKLAKVVSDLNLEYAAISTKLERYDKWFEILAKKTGVKLPI